MQCPSCDRENPPDARFCVACGKPVESTCPQCGTEIVAGASFCHGCGAAVDAPSEPVSPQQSKPTEVGRVAREPQSFANGRYQVQKFLGEGGKKRVYLAQDTLLDREVAFALIKVEGPYSRRGLNHIFMSHVHEDSSLAIELADALEAKGYSTWYYERDSVPGPAYLAQMGEAIEQADAVVLLISESSVNSNQVTTEVVRAHESNKAFCAAAVWHKP